MPFKSWNSLWFESAGLTLDASHVIGLRLNKLAAWDKAALSEAKLMFAEKFSAMAELQMLAMTGGLGHTPHGQAAETITHLRRKVTSNRRRLSAKRKRG